MRNWLVPPLFMLVLAAGCASAGGGANAAPKRGARNVITAQEIQQLTGVSTAYEAVQRLRPQFLNARSTVLGSGGTVVYVNGMRRGGVNALQQVAANEVKEIRYISARDATTKYGSGLTQGVIEVTTR